MKSDPDRSDLSADVAKLGRGYPSLDDRRAPSVLASSAWPVGCVTGRPTFLGEQPMVRKS
jgi:hypothetical protein